MTSADSRLAATSKDVRVRVESSKNRLTTVRPRSVGSFFTDRSDSRLISSAVSRMSTASSRDRSAAESRCRVTAGPPVSRRVGRRAGRRRGTAGGRGGLPDEHRVPAVHLLEQDVHHLRPGSRDVLADVVGADGQLAVSAVDEHRQLDDPRPAVLGQRVKRRPNRAAGEQHVVDEDDDRVVETGGGKARLLEGPDPAHPQIVPVHRGSIWPVGSETPSKASIRAASRRASGTPRVGMPSRTTSCPPEVFSSTSCAIRDRARESSPASRIVRAVPMSREVKRST